jgi:hypothetical protein
MSGHMCISCTRSTPSFGDVPVDEWWGGVEVDSRSSGAMSLKLVDGLLAAGSSTELADEP